MPNTYTLLEQITVGAAGASSVTFNSIPQTGYTDLVVKVSVRTNRADFNDGLSIKLNNSTTGYSSRSITYDNGSAVSYTNLFGVGYVINTSGNTPTANTFSNQEIYIPNYTSSNFKSFSSDTAVENNGLNARVEGMASLWSNTAAVTSIVMESFTGSRLMQHSTFSLYGVSALGVTPTKAPKATGGSIIQTDGTYWYHAFLSSGTFTPATALSCDVLVVAGGGSGANQGGGGGGAGGLLYFASQSLGTSAQTVTIGAGGAGTPIVGAAPGSNGSDSQFGSLTLVKGGGYGGNYSTGGFNSGGNQGSGGGAQPSAGGTLSGGTATSGQGNNGGSGSTDNSTYRSSGGGGGAGVAGGNGNTSSPAISGKGGDGVTTYSSWGSVTGTGENISGTYWFAGGGGGGNGTAGAKGNGGGTAGVNNGSSANAIANTGGGSGACGGTNVTSGNGGSGVVIVRYLA